MDRWTDLLSEYVDGTLPEASRIELEVHLSECEACRLAVADLRLIKEGAAALEPIPASVDLWPRIARALGQEPTSLPRQPRAEVEPVARWQERMRAWRASSQRTRWLATAALVLLVVAGSFTLWRRAQQSGSIAPPITAGNVQGTDIVETIESELKLAQDHYEKAIAALEQAARSQNTQVDPQIADTLQKNLAVIDQAISESRTAVRAQPQSEVAQETLLEAFQRKVSFLQDTIALMNEMRKGDPEGAGRAAEGLNPQRQ